MASKHGYYTRIGDRGSKLSGGQRQRDQHCKGSFKESTHYDT
jgi:ABC-type protease/lipase transport system fused ATPase/permease subunit